MLRARAIVLATLAAVGCAHGANTAASPPGASSDPEAIARTFVGQLAASRFAEAEGPFTEAMRQGLPPEKLAALWQDLSTSHGTFQGVEHTSAENVPGGSAELVTCRFAKSVVTLEVYVTAGDRIGGLFTTPASLIASLFVSHLASGEAAAAEERFDARMREALPPPKLAEVWNQLRAQFGAFDRIESRNLVPTGESWSALLRARFAKGAVILNVAVDGEGRIAGVHVQPADSGIWQTPTYADPKRFTERAIEVRDAAPLPGHLTVPVGAGPFPGVVLVHGSGPGDEDETVGDIRVFKDLAVGLASRGIAVLRYDKRTRVAPAGVRTVREEYFGLVKAALGLLRGDPNVDSRRIIVLGHSQGASLAPWIARDNPELAGIVMLAAASRPLLDLVVEQLDYLLTLDPKDAALEAELKQVSADRDRLASKDLNPDEPLYHATAAYYLALKGYDPAQVAATLTLPMLVLQGGRDYQVSPERDFARFQAELAGHPNATLRLYPALNHLFVAGTGKSKPAEYSHPGHVAEAVIEDIASWIAKLPPHLSSRVMPSVSESVAKSAEADLDLDLLAFL